MEFTVEYCSRILFYCLGTFGRVFCYGSLVGSYGSYGLKLEIVIIFVLWKSIT